MRLALVMFLAHQEAHLEKLNFPQGDFGDQRLISLEKHPQANYHVRLN